MTDLENKLNDVENQTSNSVSLEKTKSEAAETLIAEKLPEVIDEKGNLTIDGLAKALGMEKQLVKLPNGKEVMSLVWKPEQLPQVFEIITKSEIKRRLGKNDLVTIDGACPGWLLTTMAHALHPVCVAVKYPQGGPDAVLPVSGFEMEDEGKGQDLKFDVKELEDRTEITFSLENPNIDAQATINSLVAPSVPAGKPVFISGRGPIAILTALADAYAHKVPFVACFQPGTGNVVAISHSDVDLGTIL